MSVGDTQLASLPLSTGGADSGSGLSIVPLLSGPALLCTGEIEAVRGVGGTFPANLSTSGPGGSRLDVYHPRGSVAFCLLHGLYKYTGAYVLTFI
jgi:hypothetical protein